MALPRQTRPGPQAAAAPDRTAAPLRPVLMTSAAMLAVALSLWAGGAFAQEEQTDPAQTAQAPADAGAQTAPGAAPDALVATVGDAEIRTSDLRQAIGQLPPTLSSQPPELLASAALQQLLLREAIVQQARSAGLAQDPEVRSLVETAARAAEEDALVQVWLERELASRVPPQAVEQAYAALGAITTGELPPLEQLRPQIEENLRRQAIEEIQAALLTGADITFYGPDGQPRSAQGGAGGQAQDGAAAGQDGAGSQPLQGQATEAPGDGQGGDASTESGQPPADGAADQGGTSEQPSRSGD